MIVENYILNNGREPYMPIKSVCVAQIEIGMNDCADYNQISFLTKSKESYLTPVGAAACTKLAQQTIQMLPDCKKN